MKHRVLGASLVMAVAAALGFGATQALASPATSAAAQACDAVACNEYCLMQPCGGGGRCLPGGTCLCAYYACAAES